MMPRLADRLFPSVGVPAAAWTTRLLARTLRLRIDGVEQFETAMRTRRPLIFVFWHEDLFAVAALYLLRNWRRAGAKRAAVLISRSRDGEMLAGVVGRLGMHAVRGSSSKGAVRSLIDLERWLKDDDGRGRFVSLALDGPRGPRRVAKPGAALLARRTGALVLPLAIRFSRQWVFNSWDRAKLAKPWARMECVCGPLLDAGESADEDEAFARRLQAELDRLHGDEGAAPQN